MLSEVPKDSTLGPLLFIIFVNDLCAKIHFSEFLPFGDDLKIFCARNSTKDYKFLHSDIDSIQKWRTETNLPLGATALGEAALKII
jgi:hypothetical protein